MSYLQNNWHILVLIVVAAVAIGYDIYAFSKLSPAQQKEKVKEWLIWAVIQAEAELGGGTGQLKLRRVYEMFISSFPWLVRAVSFEEFSKMVDEALVKMREMIEKNVRIKDYVETSDAVKLEDLIKKL